MTIEQVIAEILSRESLILDELCSDPAPSPERQDELNARQNNLVIALTVIRRIGADIAKAKG
ncbi:MAG TPA: hypothetical protein VM163_02725 [bacterium]|nr:hypothetical protein [bacterium]